MKRSPGIVHLSAFVSGCTLLVLANAAGYTLPSGLGRALVTLHFIAGPLLGKQILNTQYLASINTKMISITRYTKPQNPLSGRQGKPQNAGILF